MGASTTSYVAFICKNDESAWAQPFMDAINAHAKDRKNELVRVPGSGFWEHEYTMGVSIFNCEVRNAGRVVVMDTEYYGTIGPARMNLPVSLQAVVFHSSSCQLEPQDPMYAVLAENVRLHDFSDTEPLLKPFWVNQQAKASELIDAFEEFEEITEEELGYDEFSDKTQTYFWDLSKNAFDQLINDLLARTDLPAPFEAAPELATIAGYLNSINHEEADLQFWTEEFGLMLPPSVEYTNTNVIGFKPQPVDICSVFSEQSPEVKAALVKLVQEVEEFRAKEKAKKKAKEDQYGHLKPTVTGRRREQIREAFLAAAVGGAADTTGIWTLLESKAGTSAYPVPGPEMQRLVMYIASRLEKSNSNVAGELETSTEGFHIYNLIDYLVLNRKWEKFELPVEAKSSGFVFNPNTDYYELFELCMSDGTTAPLDDPEDYDEFLQALKDGRYDPDKGIAPKTVSQAEEKTEEVNKEILSQDILDQFYDAQNESNFDAVLVNADKFETLIKQNIDEIAENYTEDNEYCTTGDEPEWVIKALLKAGAFIGSEAPEPAPTFKATEVSSRNDGEIDPLADVALTPFEQLLDITTTDKSDDGKNCYFKLLTPWGYHYIIEPQTPERHAWDDVKEYKNNNPGEAATLVKVSYDRNNLWTVFYYFDDGFGSADDIQEESFNTKEDLDLFVEWQNMDGHMERVKIEAPQTISFTDKRVCVTGKLSQTRKEVEALLEAAGATIASGVSKTTAYLIAGDDAGSKLAKAQEHDVTVLTEKQMMAALGQVEDESAEGEISDDEWPSFCEQLHSAGNDPDAFGYVLGQYILNNTFTEKMIGKLKKIYASTNSQELNLFELPSESDFVEYCKKAVVEYIQSDDGDSYQVGNKNFDFGHLYFAIDADTVEDTAKQMLTFAQQNADQPHVMERFTSYLLDSSESGIGDNFLCLTEPFWSAIKPYILDSEMLDVFTGCSDKLYCDDMSAETAELFEQTDVRETLAKAGVTIYVRKSKADDSDNQSSSLSQEQQAQLLERIKEVCEANTTWSNGHATAAYVFALSGKFSEGVNQSLAEFAEVLSGIDFSFTTEQYIEVAHKVCSDSDNYYQKLLQATTNEHREKFFEANECLYETDFFEFSTLSAEFVIANPEWKQALWLYLFNREEIREEHWDRIFNNEVWLRLFKEEILTNSLEILTVLITEVEEKEMTPEQLANPQQGLAIELKELYSRDILTIDLTDEQVEAIVEDIQAYVDANNSWYSDTIKTASLRLAGVALNGSGEEGMDSSAETLSDECVDTHGFAATKEQCRRCIEIFQDRYYDRTNENYEWRLEELIGNLDDNEKGIDGPVLENYLRTADDEVLKAFVRYKVDSLKDMDFLEMYDDDVLEKIKPFLPPQ